MITAIDTILNIVCTRYSLTREELTSSHGKRHTKTVPAKQEAAYLLQKFTLLKLMEIAVLLGYNSKQLINSCCRRIPKIAEGNKAYKAELQEIIAIITAAPGDCPADQARIAPAAASENKEVKPKEVKPKEDYYLKTIEGLYYSLDENRKLHTGSSPVLATKIEVQQTGPALRVICTGGAAKILRMVGNASGSAARCILFSNGVSYSLDFGGRVDRTDEYLITGLPCVPTPVQKPVQKMPYRGFAGVINLQL